MNYHQKHELDIILVVGAHWADDLILLHIGGIYESNVEAIEVTGPIGSTQRKKEMKHGNIQRTERHAASLSFVIYTT